VTSSRLEGEISLQFREVEKLFIRCSSLPFPVHDFDHRFAEDWMVVVVFKAFCSAVNYSVRMLASKSYMFEGRLVIL